MLRRLDNVMIDLLALATCDMSCGTILLLRCLYILAI